MGQMVLIDEDELADLKMTAVWFNKYYDTLQMCGKELYENEIIQGSCTNYQYSLIVLDWMREDLLKKKGKKKWRKK